MEAPFWIAVLHGTRGGGKTDALLMDYAQHVGEGWGGAWRGILFRRTYKQLSDVISRSRRWFGEIFPSARYNAADFTWRFEDGEELLLRYMSDPRDYWEYHGHEYPWIGWEEIQRWPTDECLSMMVSCSRSSTPNMPRKIRATANPFGIGHNWVKRRFIDAAGDCEPFEVEPGLKQVAIFSDIEENVALMDADPEYLARLETLKKTNPALYKAWRKGDWDIVAGGAFDDVWDRKVHIVKPFKIPSGWFLYRGFDWGSSAPFSVLWYAESSGEEFDPTTGGAPQRGGPRAWYPKGTLFVVREWYGDDGNERGLGLTARAIGSGIRDRETRWRESHGWRFEGGPADSSIFDTVNDASIAEDMEDEGVDWERANKTPGSRIRGLDLVRGRMIAQREQPMESPGFAIWTTCPRASAHIAVLERDEKNLEDVDTDQPDHDWDNVRYRVLAGGGGVATQRI